MVLLLLQTFWLKMLIDWSLMLCLRQRLVLRKTIAVRHEEEKEYTLMPLFLTLITTASWNLLLNLLLLVREMPRFHILSFSGCPAHWKGQSLWGSGRKWSRTVFSLALWVDLLRRGQERVGGGGEAILPRRETKFLIRRTNMLPRRRQVDCWREWSRGSLDTSGVKNRSTQFLKVWFEMLIRMQEVSIYLYIIPILPPD